MLNNQTKKLLFNKSFFKRNKKAQIGETMTWVFATLIIIIILSISIYAATLLAKTTKFVQYSDVSLLPKENLKTYDILMDESIFAYFLSSKEYQQDVFNRLDRMNKEGKFYSDFNFKFNKLKGDLKNG